MTDSVLKPAEFRPATNYDTNPYYDENFDHSVVDPLKQIDARFDKDEKDIADIQEDVASIQEDITKISGPFLFQVVPPAVENEPMTLDKTYADFEEALLAGKPIYQHYVDETANPPIEAFFSDLTSIGYNETDSPLYPCGVVVNIVGAGSVEFVSATKDGTLTQVQDI